MIQEWMNESMELLCSGDDPGVDERVDGAALQDAGLEGLPLPTRSTHIAPSSTGSESAMPLVIAPAVRLYTINWYALADSLLLTAHVYHQYHHIPLSL
jgi:hypothetical protein